MRIAIGMDLHKKTAVCCAVHAGPGKPSEDEEEFLRRFNRDHGTQPSEPEDIARIAEALRGHEAHVLIENSTKTHETYWVLTNLGIDTVVAQAQDLYRITKSVKKTDANDAAELAGYMRRRLNGEREFAVCKMPSPVWMERREICRAVLAEKRHLADLKRRARMHMLLHGIRLSKDYSDIFSKKAMKEMWDSRDTCLRLLVSEARSIKARTDEEARLIRATFGHITDFDLVMSIPGFGAVSAAYAVSMIIDVKRFGSSAQLAAYFGLVPKVRESAETSHRCATTHRGDREMRRLLCQSAIVHVRTAEDSVVSALYNRLRAGGVSHREAQVAAARKLVTVVWSVLRNRRPFSTDRELLERSAEMAEEAEGDPAAD